MKFSEWLGLCHNKNPVKYDCLVCGRPIREYNDFTCKVPGCPINGDSHGSMASKTRPEDAPEDTKAGTEEAADPAPELQLHS